MQETRVRTLGWKDPLEEGMATHSSIPPWRIPWTEKPGGLQFMGSQRVGHNWATNTFTHFHHILLNSRHMKVQDRKIYKDRKQIGGCLGQGGEGCRIAKSYEVSFWGDENVLKLWWWLHISVNIIETIELYTLNEWVVWNVNYISIKGLKQQQKTYLGT